MLVLVVFSVAEVLVVVSLVFAAVVVAPPAGAASSFVADAMAAEILVVILVAPSILDFSPMSISDSMTDAIAVLVVAAALNQLGRTEGSSVYE